MSQIIVLQISFPPTIEKWENHSLFMDSAKAGGELDVAIVCHHCSRWFRMVGISKLLNSRATISSGDRFNSILSQASPQVRQRMYGWVS